MKACSPLRALRRRRGQSLPEMAVIMPLVVFMVLGTLDLGRAFYTQVSLSNAAREAAKQGSLSPGTFAKGGNGPVVRAAYCELPGFAWNFTVPSASTPCAYTSWTSWNSPDPYNYSYSPVPSSPAANVAYLYIAEDLAFPGDVPGPAPAPNWDPTGPKNNGKRHGGSLPILVQIDYYWKPITPFIASLFPNGLVHIQVTSQQMEQY